MKKTIVMFVLMLGIYNCDAAMHKAKNIPEDVRSSFAKQYPQIAVEKWKMMHDTCIAMFKVDERKDFAYYFSNGTWINTETKIPWSKDLPYAVNNSFGQTNFRSWYIDYMRERESPVEKDEYVIQVHQDCGPDGSIPGDCEKIYRLYFAANGTLLREKPIR